MNKKALLPLFVVALLPLIYLGCDSANPVAPTGTVLTVTANPTSIGPNGTSIITVTGFRPDGNPLNPGTQVTLTTTLGSLTDAVLSISQGGSASTVLTGDGRLGTATITASTPATESTATIDVTVEVRAANLIINANPQSIPTGGESLIEVLARDNNNVPLGAGQRIQMFASLGEIPPEIFTNAQGRAHATFRALDEGGDATIRAVLGSSEPASTTVTIRINVETITLSGPQSINREEQDISLTAQALDGLNRGVPRVFVTFSAPFGEFRNAQGQPIATTTQTDGNGVVTVRLHVTLEEITTYLNNNDTNVFTVTVTAPTETGNVPGNLSITIN